MNKRVKRWLGGTAAAILCAAAALAVLDRVCPPDLTRLAHRSTLVLDRDGHLLQAFTAADGAWRLPVAADQVDPRFLGMLIAYEDKRFFSHWGIDPLALARAVRQLVDEGRVVSGASTLTMQTVRLLEPRQRTLGAKLIEMARALQLEWRYSKPQILDMYLTLAPYGGNLEGVRAASLFYFGKEPARLTDAEAALLVALPQSPERLRPDRRAAAALAQRDRVLASLAGRGVLSAQAAAEAAVEPVPATRNPAIRRAPHLAERLHEDAGDGLVIATTIDGALQAQAEALARRVQAKLEPGATVAMLVVENAGRTVRSYVGSGDFWDASRYGQNDMVRAVRSPGSALKPFIYGMAFDDLIVHPETIVVDRPMRFGDYAPENFDHFYRGEVSAREALQLSLNLPAVALLDRIGPLRLTSVLKRAGAPLRLPGEVTMPGLPIALGGVGTTLEDMVQLYAGIADGGLCKPLRFSETVTPPNDGGMRLMSPAAAWYVTRILEEAPPPPNTVPPQHRKRGHAVAFKTGTSYGFRDAWAIGYDAAYTIGVWIGRPDGTFSPGRIGREAAAPVLYDLFDLLPEGEGAAGVANPERPAGVLIASNGKLPPALRRFEGPAGPDRGIALANAPRIAFPVDGATLPLAAGAAFRSLQLEAEGGKMPLLWLVNGQAIDSLPYRRKAEWQPDGSGAARITVIDAAGHSASAEIWIE
ncbi:MAG TPA: penicillin-binding protein 1C [Dongiaceae bacterium]